MPKKNAHENHIETHWITVFLRRTPSVKTLSSLNLKVSWYNGATTEIIEHYFVTKSEGPAIKAMKPENYYNVDKPRIMERLWHNGLVVEGSKKKLQDKNQDWAPG